MDASQGHDEGATSALVDLAVDGLRQMYLPATREFVQTVRGLASDRGPVVVGEGRNLRYAAIVALGLGDQNPDHAQRALGEHTVAELVTASVSRARTHPDFGAIAISAWADVEVLEQVPDELFSLLEQRLSSGEPVETVALSWLVTAGASAMRFGFPPALIEQAARLLRDHQGPHGIFPHAIPARSVGRMREHVGSFADQVYPLQALARYAAVTGDQGALAAAERTAARLVQLQGAQGQWWWHYDVRTGGVVERFPVYSVHQHGMGPMVLRDLAACGGTDHSEAVALGERWLDVHPESFEELVDHRHQVVWRKVGRREPPKAARRVATLATRVRPGIGLGVLDSALPVGVVDHECRPYELGWLLYARYRAGRKDLLH